MLDSSRRNDTHGTAGPPCARDLSSTRDENAGDTPELLIRFPSLARFGRARFGAFPSRVQQVEVSGRPLWVKRDDANAARNSGGTSGCTAGNKLRALEFLLAGVRPGDTVLALGGDGSTHVLATSALAHRLGARVVAVRWPHEMNETARRVERRTRDVADDVRRARGPVRAVAQGWLLSRRNGRTKTWWIPPGGASPIGMLGAVNAGLELAAQVARGEMPAPAYVVLPLGTGGTAAGLALGFAIAELDAQVAAVRVVPRIMANRWRVRRLAGRCARLIERVSGNRVPRVPRRGIRVLHDYYGGAYGRPLGAAREVRERFERLTGVVLDETYGAKAFAAAVDLAQKTNAPTLYWLTFDARCVSEHAAHSLP
ncbi:MAG TPA: pyridoxal-phosphate dependent enzyme [Gemmatimonadaceae bacterium]|nr:pyridoxal-phosphate dependent enzyme [Gemmatimonadaceae bacterium]